MTTRDHIFHTPVDPENKHKQTCSCGAIMYVYRSDTYPDGWDDWISRGHLHAYRNGYVPYIERVKFLRRDREDDMSTEAHVHEPLADKGNTLHQICACGAERYADTGTHNREWLGWDPWRNPSTATSVKPTPTVALQSGALNQAGESNKAPELNEVYVANLNREIVALRSELSEARSEIVRLRSRDERSALQYRLDQLRKDLRTMGDMRDWDACDHLDRMIEQLENQLKDFKE